MESSWSCLGSLEVSWRPLGTLLERSWRPPGPKKRSPERLLGAPRGISRQVSAILGAKRLPKRSPGGSKMGLQRRLELKKAKSQKLWDVLHEKHISEAPGLPKTRPERVQNWFQIASSTRRPSESLWRASWSALGGLRSRKKEVGNGSWPAWGQKGGQNGDPKDLLVPIFTIPDWGPNLDPHFIAFQVDF